MTQCIGSPAHEMAEQYLAGSLPESESERFEDHYFGCELCHGYLLALQEVQGGLARAPIAISATGVANQIAPGQSLRGRLLSFPARKGVLGAIAAALIVGAVVIGMQRRPPVPLPDRAARSSTAPLPGTAGSGQDNVAINRVDGQPNRASESGASTGSDKSNVPDSQTTELAALADLHLPGYEQPQLRGVESEDSDHLNYSTGMQAYTQGDCDGALRDLAKVPINAEDGLAARLYSGFCQLKGRALGPAQASFVTVIGAGDTPQLETAEYFLAQTMLLRGDAVGASNWLSRTVAIRGDYEERARKQQSLLPLRGRVPR